MVTRLDPRRHPYRADIAAEHLSNLVTAERYVSAEEFQVVAPLLDLFAAPDSEGLASQLLYGERFDVFDIAGGFAWGQSQDDGYVGYVELSGLGAPSNTNASVLATRSHIYPKPNFKTKPIQPLPFQARLNAGKKSGAFVKTDAGFVPSQHIMLDSAPSPADYVEEAKRFLGAPYLWGGRSPSGIDCSALVQLSLAATGQDCPRDSDMQQDELGRFLDHGAPVETGDLFFWKGHVAIAADARTLIHANAHHMAVSFEPLGEAIDRIAKSDGPVVAHKRISRPDE